VSVVLGLAVVAAVGFIALVVIRRARDVAGEQQHRQDIAQLLADRPGGAPDRPLRVASAAEIEPRAQREPCPWCAGNLHVAAHEVQEHQPELLRRVTSKCGTCGRTLVTWFHVDTPLVN
jgi:hypothetical protein